MAFIDWSVIADNPLYLAKPETEKAALRDEWFKTYLEPTEAYQSMPENLRAAYYSQLMEDFKREDDLKTAPEQRSLIEKVGSRLGRGALNVVESVGQAAELADFTPKEIESKDEEPGLLDRVGRGMTDWAQKTRQDTQALRPDIEELKNQEGRIKGGILEGVESSPLSFVPWGQQGPEPLQAAWWPVQSGHWLAGLLAALLALLQHLALERMVKNTRRHTTR